MTLTEMRALVRRDLKDEDATAYRWTNDEIDRHIARAVAELSRHVPQEMKTTKATVAASRNIDISTLTDRVSVDKVEFPVGDSPQTFQRFKVYQDVLTLIGDTEGDGANCYIFWSAKHTLGASSTLPTYLEDVVALGAAAYALSAQAQYVANQANTGGETVDRDYFYQGKDMMNQFKEQLKLYSRKKKLQVGQLYEGSDKE